MRSRWLEGSPPPPPNNNEEPKHNDEENHVPQPPTTLALGHVVHATKCSVQNPGRLCKRVGLWEETQALGVRRWAGEFCAHQGI